MGVEGESGAYFFSKSSTTVVAGGQFEVHASPFSIGRVVLDANVGKRNLSADHVKPVLFGDSSLAFGGSMIRTESREVMVDPLFQLVVEYDAKVTAPLAVDLLRSSLIEPVQVGIVMSLARLGEAVVQRLMFAGSLGLREKTMPVLGESEQLAGAGFLVRNGFHCDESLT